MTFVTTYWTNGVQIAGQNINVVEKELPMISVFVGVFVATIFRLWWTDRQCHETRQARTHSSAAARRSLEKEWKKNGCIKLWSGKWIVPYELIWRSLPHGEDR